MMKINKLMIMMVFTAFLGSCMTFEKPEAMKTNNKAKGAVSVGRIHARIASPAKPKLDLNSIKDKSFDDLESDGQGGFKVKFIEPTDIYFGNGFVTGNGIGVPIAPNAPVNPFPLPRGTSNANVDWINVPTGNNRVVTATGLDANQAVIATHYEVKGVVNVNPGMNTVTLSMQTTPTARVIESLIGAASPFADTVDNALLQTVVDRLVDNNTGIPGDDIHPSLVNHTAIAAFIIGNAGALPPAVPVDRATFAFTPGTITGTISGIQEGYRKGGADRTVFPPVTVVADDPASVVFTQAAQNQVGVVGSMNYTINNVTPMNNITITVQPNYHTSQTATVNVTPGGTTNQNFAFAAGNKRHWFQEAIPGQTVSHYSPTNPIDILIVKPSNPAATAVGYDPAVHLAATRYATEQLKTLFANAFTIGQIDEVFDNDPGFGVTPLPPIGSNFPSSTGNVNSPNHPANLNINLVGRYDHYIVWTTKVTACPDTTIGLAYSGFASSTTYTTKVELSTQGCSGVLNYETSRALTSHELIHAIGGTFHSSSQTDVMFPSVGTVRRNPHIRDINTVRFLYHVFDQVNFLTSINTDRIP